MCDVEEVKMIVIGIFCFIKWYVGVFFGFRDCDFWFQVIFEVVFLFFEVKGVGVISIDDIIQYVGIVKGMFYYYFCDRSVLFDEI